MFTTPRPLDPLTAFTGPLDKTTARVLGLVECFRTGMAWCEKQGYVDTLVGDLLAAYSVAAIHDRKRLVARVRRVRYPLRVPFPACSWLEAVYTVIIDDLRRCTSSVVTRDLERLAHLTVKGAVADPDDPMVAYYRAVAGKNSFRPLFKVRPDDIGRWLLNERDLAVRAEVLIPAIRVAVAEHTAREYPMLFRRGKDLHFDMLYTDYVAAGGRFEVASFNRYVEDDPDEALVYVVASTFGIDPDHADHLLFPTESITVHTDPGETPPWCTPTTLRPDAVLDPEGAQTLLWRVAELTRKFLK